jgi:hypothetical protein
MGGQESSNRLQCGVPSTVSFGPEGATSDMDSKFRVTVLVGDFAAVRAAPGHSDDAANRCVRPHLSTYDDTPAAPPDSRLESAQVERKS